jgi:hypothetical protein
MTKEERVCKRPTTVSARQKLTDKRVLEALEREEAQGTKHPEHLRKLKGKLKAKLKEAKA